MVLPAGMLPRMRYLMPLAAMLVVTSIIACSVVATEIHVSPKPLPGIDASAQARTITDALKRVPAGGTIIIHGGVYREAVTITTGGTAGKPLTIKAAFGERVVITGADPITDWKREDSREHIYSTPWPHAFIGWTKTMTHPDDDYHLLIGRCEQVFADGYLLRQVLSRDKLSRGTFFADTEGKRLFVWTSDNADLAKERKTRIEASVRPVMLKSKADHVQIRGIRFRYAANRAQESAVSIEGKHNVLEDCIVEHTNSIGAGFDGAENAIIRRCTFQYNGQMGFGASHAHNLLMTECMTRGNNTKGWNRNWEAGGDKIAFCRGLVIEKSQFVENRGAGIWFDIANEQCIVRNCLIADNEHAGIFYEISYSLHAHDNVIVGNGFDADGGAWGASAGIAISSSPQCVVERNILVGNKEGFAYREQYRSTPRLGKKEDDGEPVWNHDQTVRNNILAFNRDAQVWGWFDQDDNRQWPAAMQSSLPKQKGRAALDMAAEYQARSREGHPTAATLEKLNLSHSNNLFFAAPGQGLFNWGVGWGHNRKYPSLDDVRRELNLEAASVVADPCMRDFLTRDFRVPAGSAAIKLGAYPRGEVPGVQLGTGD